MKISDFGTGPNGEPINLFVVENSKGLSAHVTNYGGIITQLHVPDHQGRLGDVVLGFSSLQPYLNGRGYWGAIVGRVAGRITGGAFSIDGRQYHLSQNRPPHHAHGGWLGFDRRVWTAQILKQSGGEALRLHYRSLAGEEGYPGNVNVAVTYFLSPENALHIDYSATTDEATPISLTSHSYFNLRGEGSGDIGNHVLQILADAFTPVNSDFSFVGTCRSVDGLPNDFRIPARMGSRLGHLLASHGDNYLLPNAGDGVTLVARVCEPHSGRGMEVYSNERCIQFYTGAYLDGSAVGKSGKSYERFSGFCLECQGFPDAPNHPEFESTILRPGDLYRRKTVYRFLSAPPTQ